MTAMSDECATTYEHVRIVSAAVAAGQITKREAVDGLCARWELTRVGALDLVNRGVVAFDLNARL